MDRALDAAQPDLRFTRCRVARSLGVRRRRTAATARTVQHGEAQTDHVGRDVVRQRVVQAQGVAADPQAGHHNGQRGDADRHECRSTAVGAGRRAVPERPRPRSLIADRRTDEVGDDVTEDRVGVARRNIGHVETVHHVAPSQVIRPAGRAPARSASAGSPRCPPRSRAPWRRGRSGRRDIPP